MDDIVIAMSEYLGEAEYADKEWGYSVWHGMKITKFSNAPFGNCFDIEIQGEDCYIQFGLSTI